MIPALKEYYFTLLSNMELIETDKQLLSELYINIADSFSRLPFSFDNQEEIILPFANKAMAKFIQSQDVKYCSDEYARRLEDSNTIKAIVAMNYRNSPFVKDTNTILQRSNLETYDD